MDQNGHDVRGNTANGRCKAEESCRVLLLSSDTPWATNFRDEIKRMKWQLKRLDSPFDALATIPEFDPHLLVISEYHSDLTLADLCDAIRIPRLFRPVQVVITNTVPEVSEFDLVELGVDELLSVDEPGGRYASILVPQFKLANLSRTLISREQEILDGLPNPLFVVDSNLSLWKVNRAMAHCIGIDPVEKLRQHLGIPLNEAIVLASGQSSKNSPAATLAETLKAAFKEGRAHFRYRQNGHGGERVYSARITELQTEHDRRLIDLRDITEDEANLRQEARRERLATIGNLALGVAHEIQNPNTFSRVNAANLEELFGAISPLLDAIESEHKESASQLPEQIPSMQNGAGSALNDKVTQLPRMREMIGNAIQGVQMASVRIAHVLETLRNFGRVESAPLVTMNAAAAIREAIVLTKHVCRDHCELRLELPEVIPEVIASQTELSQVFVNLIQNAVRAFSDTAPQKRGDAIAEIRIYLHCETERDLTIGVADNGPGISEAMQAYIFRPYFTTHGQGEGTGLGLSLSSDIMQRSGGDLTVQSSAGEGATFLVTIPKARTARANTAITEEPNAL